MLLPTSAVFAYEKATDSTEVVLDKLFPKRSKLEIDAKGGYILNSSYSHTMLAGGGLTYFWSEEWGFNADAFLALVKDKPERACIENFYNNPNHADLGAQCGGADNLSNDKKGDANFGPAYVPIRKLKYMFTGNFVWNPIYGKQIFLLSATNYFDFYLIFGGGIALSDYYPLVTNFPDGRAQRAQQWPCTKEQAAKTGCNPKQVGTTDTSLIGIPGEPVPQSESNVMIHLAVGQRYHFFKRFELMGSLENYTLLGTEQGFDNFLTLVGGLGMRF